MRASRIVLITAVITLALAPAVRAYLKFGVQIGNQVVGMQWNHFPIRYSITSRDVPGVTAAQLQTVAAQSLATWANAGHVVLSSQFQGFTNLDPIDGDGQTVIGFQAHPELDRVLGETTFVNSTTTGEIIESDIFLNSIASWSVAAGGQSGRYDVQSVLTHELGHFLGLGHSALGETELRSGGRNVLGKRAVMFPIAYASGSTVDRNLQADDVAGITDIYGDSTASSQLGAIQGRVTLNNVGVFGAHVTASNPATGETVAGYTLTDRGEFVISALKPGQYIVRVEPLDDIDLDSVFDPDQVININFQVTFYGKPVSVPAGGAGASITIAVKSK